MANRGLALGVAALLALAACSSDAEADPEETQADTTSTEPDGTAPTDTPAPTTATPAETEPPVATDAPTTTVDEAAVIADVEAAYFAAFDAYHAAILDPTDEDLRQAVESAYVGGGLEFVSQILDDLVAFDRVAKPNRDVEPFTVITGEVRFENPERTEASLVACQILPEAFYEIGSGPDGEDALLRDDVIRADVIAIVRLTDDGWKSAGGDTRRELTGVRTCDPI